MIFLKVDDMFCKLMQQYARGRLLVDCGAGEGLFQSKMPQDSVLSLDIRMLEEQHAPVLPKDCLDFPFARGTIPVFIRPCHSSFVHDTIIKNLGVVDSFLYVSMPHNVERDLDPDSYQVHHIFPDWKGSAGEYIYEITANKTEEVEMHTFVLVKMDHHNTVWWYEKRGDKLVNHMGGYCFLDDCDEIVEEVQAEDFESLDWTKTTLLVSDDATSAGWLDREGKFYGCDSEDHDTLAYFLLKKEVEELEKTGWVRVYGPPGSDPDWTLGGRFELRLSAEQRNWLSLGGYKVDEDD